MTAAIPVSLGNVVFIEAEFLQCARGQDDAVDRNAWTEVDYTSLKVELKFLVEITQSMSIDRRISDAL